MWQHVNLSAQICPWETLACCWDVKQPTNNSPNRWACSFPKQMRWACSFPDREESSFSSKWDGLKIYPTGEKGQLFSRQVRWAGCCPNRWDGLVVSLAGEMSSLFPQHLRWVYSFPNRQDWSFPIRWNGSSPLEETGCQFPHRRYWPAVFPTGGMGWHLPQRVRQPFASAS